MVESGLVKEDCLHIEFLLHEEEKSKKTFRIRSRLMRRCLSVG
jgi:hypothetical protein